MRFLVLGFGGQHHSYIFIKCLVTSSIIKQGHMSASVQHSRYSRIQYQLHKPVSAPHHSLLLQSQIFPPKDLHIISNHRPAYGNQLSQVICVSTRHRRPKSERRLLYQVTKTFRVGVGFRMIWRCPPPFFFDSLDYTQLRVVIILKMASLMQLFWTSHLHTILTGTQETELITKAWE